jgi:hypothetical protein
MASSIIVLDVMLTGALLLLIAGYLRFHISTHTWLKTHGTYVSALITQVRRDNIAHQTCVVIACWTDPRTGRRCKFHGYRLDLVPLFSAFSFPHAFRILQR